MGGFDYRSFKFVPFKLPLHDTLSHELCDAIPQHPKPSIFHIVSNTALRDPANHYDRLYKHSCISSLNPAIPPECQASPSSKQRLASELLSQLESNLKSSLPMSEPSCLLDKGDRLVSTIRLDRRCWLLLCL